MTYHKTFRLIPFTLCLFWAFNSKAQTLVTQPMTGTTGTGSLL